MVLLTQVAALAGFTYTSWQIIGRWYRFHTRNEGRQDDATLFTALDDAVTSAKSDAESGRKADYGAGAAASGNSHVFAEFKKLPLQMRVQLVEDLARVAEWSGQANKDIKRMRARGGWKKLSMRERGRVLGALDALSFAFAEEVKRRGAVAEAAEGSSAADAWLWQLTEPLPLLAAEPTAVEGPVRELAALQAAVAPVETEVKSLLDAKRAAQLGEAKEKVLPIVVAGATRNLQMLKELLVGDLGLDTKRSEAATKQLAALLEGPLKSLVPEQAEAAAEASAAEAALVAEGDAAADAARAAAMPGVEANARAVFVRELVGGPGATRGLWSGVWTDVDSARFPVKASNALARRVALVEAVLAELEGAPEGEAGAPELADAARRYVPLLLPALGLKAANVPPPAAEEATAVADDAAAAAATAAAPPPTAAERAAQALTALADAGGARAAARSLLSLIGSAADAGLLKKGPVAAATACADDAAVVSGLVASVFRRVLAASGAQVDDDAAVDREAIRKEAVAAASDVSAAIQHAALNKVEADASQARSKALLQGLSDRAAALATQPTSVRIVLANHKLKDARHAKDLPSAAAAALAMLRDSDLAVLPAAVSAAARQAADLAEQLEVTSEVTAAGGLELGPGVTALLERLQRFLATQLEASAEREKAKKQEEEAAVAAAAAAEAAKAEAAEGSQAAGEGEGEAKAKEEEGAEVKEKAAASAPTQEAAAPSLPPLRPAQLNAAQALVTELLGEGLVLLELNSLAYKRLRMIREGVEAMQTYMPAQGWDRALAGVKELVAQLGPIGAAVDARVKETESEQRRFLLLQLRGAAVDLYRCMQDLMNVETATRPEVLQAVAAIKESAFSMKVEKKVVTLEALMAKLETLEGRREEVESKVAGMQGSEAAVRVLQALQDQATKLGDEVRQYMQYMKLREHALGTVPPACPTDMEVPEFPSLADTQVLHAEDCVWLDMSTSEEEDQDAWCMAGFKLVARGQAAVVLLAGGVEGDKARVTLDIGLPSTKSLLQLYAERLQRIQHLAAEALYGQGSGVVHPMQWYILATSATRAGIVQCLEEAAYFGLEPSQVHVAAPDLSVPLLAEDCKVAMEGPNKLARAAGGSGEIFRGLRESNLLDHMRRSGVRCMDVHAVDDNVMARIADPIFLGYCQSIGLDCAAKVVDPDAMQMTTYGYAMAAGVLSGGGGAEEGPVMDRLPGMMPAIGQYYFAMPWVVQVDSALKRNPLALYRLSPANVVSKAGAKAPGYKLERCITDFVLGGSGAAPGDEEGEEQEERHGKRGGAYALVPGQQFGLVVVEVSEQFSAVWGSSPYFAPDTANSAVEDMLLTHTSWVEAAGGALADPEEGVVEVSPLVSYSGEGLEELVEGKEFAAAYELDLQGFGAAGARGGSGGRAKTNVGPWMAPFLVVYAALAAAKVATSLK